ncbi:MAG TPA: hypothetical protein VF771_10810 [Longimicrobiaceae bacterium]
MRELAAKAHEEELRRALLPLADSFDAWRRGEVSSGDLSHLIHEFHDGAAREIWKSYNVGHLTNSVAYAIHTGVLSHCEVPVEVLETLRMALAFYQDQDRLEAAEAYEDEI